MMGCSRSCHHRVRWLTQPGVRVCREIPLALEDIFYDPQTSGGLLIALPAEAAEACLAELQKQIPQAARIGYVTELQDAAIKLE